MSMDVIRILAAIGIVHLVWDALAVAVVIACCIRAAEERYPGQFG